MHRRRPADLIYQWRLLGKTESTSNMLVNLVGNIRERDEVSQSLPRLELSDVNYLVRSATTILSG